MVRARLATKVPAKLVVMTSTNVRKRTVDVMRRRNVRTLKAVSLAVIVPQGTLARVIRVARILMNAPMPMVAVIVLRSAPTPPEVAHVVPVLQDTKEMVSKAARMSTNARR